MKKKRIFSGCATALITPFSGGAIDYPRLASLIDAQIASGISALVIGGTTAEAATLDDGERYELFNFTKERAAGRAKLIFGTGTNDTRKAISHTKTAEEIGCDGVLVVTPYYNKGTASGLVEHYKAIAESVDLPIIVYNVPSRTGVNLSINQLEKLAPVQNIVAIKEAGDSLDRLVELSLFGDELALYAGCDSHIYSVLALGGQGVISVASNLYPEWIKELCDSFFDGNAERSLKIQSAIFPFISSIFKETNPAPIKYALSRSGLCENELRLPLSPISAETERLVAFEMERLSTRLSGF